MILFQLNMLLILRYIYWVIEIDFLWANNLFFLWYKLVNKLNRVTGYRTVHDLISLRTVSDSLVAHLVILKRLTVIANSLHFRHRFLVWFQIPLVPKLVFCNPRLAAVRYQIFQMVLIDGGLRFQHALGGSIHAVGDLQAALYVCYIVHELILVGLFVTEIVFILYQLVTKLVFS